MESKDRKTTNAHGRRRRQTKLEKLLVEQIWQSLEHYEPTGDEVSVLPPVDEEALWKTICLHTQRKRRRRVIATAVGTAVVAGALTVSPLLFRADGPVVARLDPSAVEQTSSLPEPVAVPDVDPNAARPVVAPAVAAVGTTTEKTPAEVPDDIEWTTVEYPGHEPIRLCCNNGCDNVAVIEDVKALFS